MVVVSRSDATCRRPRGFQLFPRNVAAHVSRGPPDNPGTPPHGRTEDPGHLRKKSCRQAPRTWSFSLKSNFFVKPRLSVRDRDDSPTAQLYQTCRAPNQRRWPTIADVDIEGPSTAVHHRFPAAARNTDGGWGGAPGVPPFDRGNRRRPGRTGRVAPTHTNRLARPRQPRLYRRVDRSEHPVTDRSHRPRAANPGKPHRPVLRPPLVPRGALPARVHPGRPRLGSGNRQESLPLTIRVAPALPSRR